MQIKKLNKVAFPLHIVKRMDLSKKTKWIIRLTTYVIAFFLAAIFTNILKPGTFGDYFTYMIEGVFDFSDIENFLLFLENAAILLLLSLALLPAFKMKFWNIGAEGQATVGCIVAALITTYAPVEMSEFLVVILALLASVVAGIIWGLIPALCKAFFNTNETLFTLLMNYIAIGLAAFIVPYFHRTPSGTWGIIDSNQLIEFGDMPYILTLIIVGLITVAMFFYLKSTKHGYELSVVGESQNTARYVGINVKKVIIRTIIISGALAGLAGFLIVCGNEHTLSSGLVNGRGFTAVLITWLGHFDVLEILMFSLISAFFSRGAFNAASNIGITTDFFTGMITGLFFLVVVASEFFANYKIVVTHKVKNKEDLVQKEVE